MGAGDVSQADSARLGGRPPEKPEPLGLPPGGDGVDGKSELALRQNDAWELLLTWHSVMGPQDFERERKWKLGQAKKLSGRVAKEVGDGEGRGGRRRREEEQRVRRVAASEAREVRLFWSKVEKLVKHRHGVAVEGTRKKAMEKHLSFLIGQTERYSSMLALNLADPNYRPKPLPKPPGEEEEEEEEEEEVLTGGWCRWGCVSEDCGAVGCMAGSGPPRRGRGD